MSFWLNYDLPVIQVTVEKQCMQVAFISQVLRTRMLIVNILRGDKYKEKEPDAVDMYKECHNSKKKGYTPDVQLLVVS
jgi:hypothetical protein